MPIVKVIVGNGYVRDRADSRLEGNVVIAVGDVRIPDGDVGGTGGIDAVRVGSGAGRGDLRAPNRKPVADGIHVELRGILQRRFIQREVIRARVRVGVA